MAEVRMADDPNIQKACKIFYDLFKKRIALAQEVNKSAAGSHVSILTRAKRAFEALMATSNTMAITAVSDLKMQILSINGYLIGQGEKSELFGFILMYERYEVVFDDGSVLRLDKLE